MILTIDGYDGTGKTTLAKKLSSKYGLLYIEKPFIKKYQIEHNCPYEEAVAQTQIIEKKLFSSCTHSEIATYYCNAILWLKEYVLDKNVILDRGLLTTYAVVGDTESAPVFEEFIKRGAFHDASIYLTAQDEERVRRIYNNDPNDPDLKYPIKWRDNDLEDFANRQKLNYFKISTDDKTKDQVFEEACLLVENLFREKNKQKSKK